MQKIKGKWKLLLYGCAGLGVNMLNLIVGSYLCSALLVGGFDEHIAEWTYLSKDLVIGAIWAVLVLVSKLIDGIIDLPLASFTDRLKTPWGRRRPAILMGLVPMIIAYLFFLLPLTGGESLVNTIWFGVILSIFYAFYTLTMLTYYATFAEVTESEEDMVFLSNVKSVCDVIYFIFGYALLPVFISLGINIRIIALIFLPLVATMLIPLFMLKEEPTNVPGAELKVRTLTLGESLSTSLKNKNFVFWMLVACVMNVGLQLFLSGINELFSSTGLNMTVVMASSFAPVPFTILLYNKIVSKKGLGFGYRYALSIFSAGMLVMFICTQVHTLLSELQLTLIAIVGGILVSFAIGTFFSVTYTVPSRLAQIEYEKTGKSVSSMFFAVEGLFEGVAAGIATGPILTSLKELRSIHLLPIIVIIACMGACVLSIFLPRSINSLGKKTEGESAAANEENAAA